MIVAKLGQRGGMDLRLIRSRRAYQCSRESGWKTITASTWLNEARHAETSTSQLMLR